VSEKLNGLEAFHPERMASRVLAWAMYCRCSKKRSAESIK